MYLRRAPGPLLRPFVELLWTSDGAGAPPAAARELVLPTGKAHLVLRLDRRPLRLLRSLDDAAGESAGWALVGGPRAAPYLRRLAPAGPSVGALLRPGGAAALLGVPGGPLAGAHTPLDALWGAAAVEAAAERLAEVGDAAGRLALFESLLAARPTGPRGLDPLVARLLAGLAREGRVGPVLRDSGVSQRHAARRFSEAIGLAPSTWCRLRRFDLALERLAARPGSDLADLAADCGYADQAHLTRDFRAFADVTPGAYRRASPAEPRHLPL